MQLSTLFISGPPWTVVRSVINLASSESLFAKRTHPSQVRSRTKAMRICLLEASRVSPRAYVWNKGRLGWGCRTTPIKIKTINATTGLTGIQAAGAFEIAILGRSTLCIDSRDISTIWHPKRVMKITESSNWSKPFRQCRDVHLQQNWPLSTPA